MSEIKNELLVKEIIEMVHNIPFYDFDLSDFSHFQRITDLSKKVWDESHAILIEELFKLDISEDIDYQLLWYDSLGYPREIPRIYSRLTNEPKNIIHGVSPSNIEANIMFHDSNINFCTVNKDKFTFMLDYKSKGKVSNTEYDVKLSLNDLDCILKIENGSFVKIEENISQDLNGRQILSGHEYPAINYIFEKIKIPKEFRYPSKRYLFIETSSENLAEIVVVFDSVVINKK